MVIVKKAPEAADAVHSWHLDDKSKDVIDEGVQSLRKACNFGFPSDINMYINLVGHHPPRQVGDALQLVVDEELHEST